MFDFLRKRLNKTIDDATESNEEIEEVVDQVPEETEDNQETQQETSSKTTQEPDTSGNDEDTTDKLDTPAQEEDTQTDENLEEDTEDEEEEKEEEKEKEKEEEKDEEEEKEEEDKKESKGRFGFLRRNKKEDKKEEENKQEEEDKEDKEDKESDDTKYEGEAQSGGVFGFITKKTIKEEDIEDILEFLELSLLESDVAFDVADRIVNDVKEDLIGRKIKRQGDMKIFTTNALKKSIRDIIDNGTYDLLDDIEKSKQKGEPYKIMLIGINGTGKTTTIAKLATYFNKHGYSSVFGASDTFRAGAIEQLEHHANNLNLKIIKHERNSDPAAVAYDAVEHARSTSKDIVLIDTSGRMQTNANLMDELKKIKRISKPDIVIYVGDALMGNDATDQAEKFNDVIDIDGIILTKIDADAKGGAIISIGHVIHKPILFLGTGQGYDDLIEFDTDWIINKIFEEDDEEEE